MLAPLQNRNSHERAVARRRQRSVSGSMLFMSVAVLFVILILSGIGFGIYFVFFSHKLVQNWAEDFALESARRLNINDHSGKMNNLMGHSRELVFISRDLYKKACADEDLNDMTPLAMHLLQRSRDGARLVSEERDKYVRTTISDLRCLLDDYNKQIHQGVVLTNMSACDPRISDLEVGTIYGIASNVEASKGVPELMAQDQKLGYVKSGKELDLYLAAVNLKLPGEDADLRFELSPLIAPVRGTPAPMRLSRGDSFRRVVSIRAAGEDKPDQFGLPPCAVQVGMSIKVKESVLGELESRTKTIKHACAGGAWPER